MAREGVGLARDAGARSDVVEEELEVALDVLRVEVLLEHLVLEHLEGRLVGPLDELLEPLGPPRLGDDAPPGLPRLDARLDDVRGEQRLRGRPRRRHRRHALRLRGYVRVPTGAGGSDRAPGPRDGRGKKRRNV